MSFRIDPACLYEGAHLLSEVGIDVGVAITYTRLDAAVQDQPSLLGLIINEHQHATAALADWFVRLQELTRASNTELLRAVAFYAGADAAAAGQLDATVPATPPGPYAAGGKVPR